MYSDDDTAPDMEHRFDHARLACRMLRNSYETRFVFYDAELHSKELHSERLINDIDRSLKSSSRSFFSRNTISPGKSPRSQVQKRLFAGFIPSSEAVDAGVDSFIAKPLFANNVIEEFKSALRKKNASKGKMKKADLKGRKVLLAEDVEINAEIMTMVLAMRDIHVDLALNGRIVVYKFIASEPGHYDAILMNIRMPEMDGLEASSLIRSLDRDDARKIPIIALTANAFDEDVQRSLQAGMNAHLSKPIDNDELFSALESLIKD